VQFVTSLYVPYTYHYENLYKYLYKLLLPLKTGPLIGGPDSSPHWYPAAGALGTQQYSLYIGILSIVVHYIYCVVQSAVYRHCCTLGSVFIHDAVVMLNGMQAWYACTRWSVLVCVTIHAV
jgi:hypothetical protein